MEEKQNVKHYQVSGLDYTMPKLLVTMGLIMVGYFGMIISLSVAPQIVPLKLKELGTSSTLMVFIMSTLGQILNMTVCPWVSFKSDRYRSKHWGRRIPFILYTLPPLCLSWIIIGCYQTEAKWLGKLIAPLGDLSQTTLAIIVLAIGVVIFKFFYMFVGSVFYYIYYDVIPPQFLTRFMGALQITASLGSALFNFFIFEHSLTQFKWICIGMAIIYGVLMGLMCFLLKEPRFPEPDPVVKKQSNGIAGLIAFGKESFSHKIYVYENICTTCFSAAGAGNIFTVFMVQSMGMTLADIGNRDGISGICGTIATFAVAAIGSSFVDKWHPVRTKIFFTPFTLLSAAYCCKWFFFTPPVNVYWWATLLLPQVLFLARFTGIAGMPFLMKLLPKSRFGQFCSARSLLASLLGIFFSLIFGVLIDILKDTLGLGELAYRTIHFWSFSFSVLGVVFYILMFIEYKKLGGYNGYQAPAIWEKSGYEKMDISPAQPANIKYLRWILYCFDGTFLLTVLGMLALAFYARYIGAAKEASLFFSVALPIAVGIFVGWYLIRIYVCRQIRKFENGYDAVLPHHGIMFMIMLMRFLILPIILIQAWLTLKQGSGTMAASLTACDLAVDLIILGSIWLYVKLEIPTKQTLNGDEINAEI